MLSFILLVLTYLALAILSREQDLNSQMGPSPEAVSAADELSLDAFSPPARSLAQRMERHGRGADLLRFQERIVEKFLRRNDPCSFGESGISTCKAWGQFWNVYTLPH